MFWTLEDALLLRIWEHSHKFFQGKSQHSNMLAKVLSLRKLDVPPSFYVVLRGDIWRTKTSDEDRPKKKLELFQPLSDAFLCWQMEHGH